MCNPLIDAQWSALKRNHRRATTDFLASISLLLTSFDVSLGCIEKHTIHCDTRSNGLNRVFTHSDTQVLLASAVSATVFTANIDFPIVRSRHCVCTSIQETTPLVLTPATSSSYSLSGEVVHQPIECSNMVSAPKKTRSIAQLSMCLFRRGIGNALIVLTALIA